MAEAGRVLWASQGGVHVDVEGEELFCQVRWSLVRQRGRGTKAVAVGDRVQVERTEDGSGVIVERLERRSVLSRTSVARPDLEQVVVANVDQLVVVVAAERPPLREHVLDRFLIAAHKGKLQPVICVNKIDLADPEDVARRLAVYESLGYPIVITSVKLPYGIEDLRSALQGRSSVLWGPSGAGKSSLLNALEPELGLRVRAVSRRTGKGGHTTTSARLYQLGAGTYVADTPGIRELQIWDLLPEEVAQYFVELEPLREQCYFRSCLHEQEPGCAIREAVEAGEIAAVRYESYLRIIATLGDDSRR